MATNTASRNRNIINREKKQEEEKDRIHDHFYVVDGSREGVILFWHEHLAIQWFEEDPKAKAVYGILKKQHGGKDVLIKQRGAGRPSMRN